MKRILTLMLVIGLASNLFSQNVLTLKSGENIKGKVVRFKSDTLFFSFKGSIMKFHSKEIVSIYFDETAVKKEEIAPLQTTTVVEPKKEQKGKVSGVVTYFFNDNLGNKPDIGARVLIINIEKAPNFDFDLIQRYINGGSKEFDDQVDRNAYKEVNKLEIEYRHFCKELAVDGNGNFSTYLAPGKYFVFVKSKNKHKQSMTELLGKIFINKVKIESDETSDLNVQFNDY